MVVGPEAGLGRLAHVASTVRRGSVVEAQAAMISTKSGLALAKPMSSVVRAQPRAHSESPVSLGTDVLGDGPRASHSAALAEHRAARLAHWDQGLQQEELVALRNGPAVQLEGLAAQLEGPAEQLDNAVATPVE